MQRRKKMRTLAAIIVAIAVGCSQARAKSDEPDPEMEALSFSYLVGGIQAQAELCGAPPSTYVVTIEGARAVLPEVYVPGGARP